MSVLEFISSMTSSLAWPLAAAVICLMLRRHLPALLTSVTKFKVPGFEIELEKAKTQVEIAAAEVQNDSSQKPEELIALEDFPDPTGAIMADFESIVDALINKLADLKIDTGNQRRVPKLLVLAESNGIITKDLSNSINGLNTLRNIAAHGRRGPVTGAEAREFRTLAEAVKYLIES